MKRATHGSRDGLGLVCNRDGTIIRSLFGTSATDTTFSPGTEFAHDVDSASTAEAEAFLQALSSRGICFDRVLQVPTGHGTVPLHFAGETVGNGVVIVGASSRSGIPPLFEGALEALDPPGSPDEPTPDESSYALMRLNNELIATQRELARKNAELRRVDRERNRILGIVGHDLRNPIGAVRGYAELLLEDLEGEVADEVLEMIRRIEIVSQLALDLTNDILDFSRIATGRLTLHRKDADLYRIVEDQLTVQRANAEQRNLTIRFESGATPLSAFVDATKISQVIANLVSNAIKYTPDGGTVDVALESDEDEARFSVRDDGPGIPPEEVDQLFKPFSTTSARPLGDEKSTGLGLAICQSLVAAHGGTIEVDTEPGRGSTFTVRLPRKQSEASSCPPRTRRISSQQSR